MLLQKTVAEFLDSATLHDAFSGCGAVSSGAIVNGCLRQEMGRLVVPPRRLRPARVGSV